MEWLADGRSCRLRTAMCGDAGRYNIFNIETANRRIAWSRVGNEDNHTHTASQVHF
jgi:hypothetical protein